MTRKSVLLTLVGLLILAQPVPIPSEVSVVPTDLRSPAAVLEIPSQACVADLSEVNEGFNSLEFENALQEFENKGEVTDEDVRYALYNPEKLLAIIEYKSRKEAYQGFGLAERIKQMNQKDRDKLYDLVVDLIEPKLKKASKNATTDMRPSFIKLTKAEQENLLAEIYKIIHRPTGLLRGTWQTKSVIKAYEKIRLYKIKKRLELSLFYEGMPKTFEIITADPKFTEKFRAVTSANRKWIDPLLFLGLWVPFAAYFPGFVSEHVNPAMATLSEVVRWLPPFVPTFAKYFEITVTDEDRALMLEKGPDYVARRIDERTGMGRRIYTGNNMRLFSAAYIAAFSILTTITFAANFNAELNFQVQADRQNIEAHWNAGKDRIAQIASFDKLTAAQKAAAQIDSALAMGNQDGNGEDPNSPAMQELKAQMATIYADLEKKREAKGTK